jgi:nucleoside-diphosphate-sugar epimerase
MEFALGDLTDAAAVRRAVEGCDAVVHLARGTRAVMTAGLDNVLRAAVEHKVRRVVHVSSVAVFGDTPPPESATEEAPLRRTTSQYGNEKLEQELLVRRYVRRHGLRAVILRPPNVYGPFSWFTLNVLKRLRAGNLPIVDGGSNPCALVGVDNLVAAIFGALSQPEAIGETFFVTDGAPITWAQCLEDHAALLGVSVPRVASAELMMPRRERVLVDSVGALMRVLPSGELRALFRQVPLFRVTESALYERFLAWPVERQSRLRHLLMGRPARAVGTTSTFSAADPLVASQGRQVVHSIAKAQRLLGYGPPVSYTEGMALTAEWLRFAGVVPSAAERQHADAVCVAG